MISGGWKRWFLVRMGVRHKLRIAAALIEQCWFCDYGYLSRACLASRYYRLRHVLPHNLRSLIQFNACDLRIKINASLWAPGANIGKVGYYILQFNTVQLLSFHNTGRQFTSFNITHSHFLNTSVFITVFYLPTDAQVNCLKNNITIHIKTAPTCFGTVTPSSGSALFVFAKVTVVKIVN